MRNEKFADVMLTLGFILVLTMSGIFGSFQIEDQLLGLFLWLARLAVTLIGVCLVGKGLEGAKGRRKSLYGYILDCE